MGIPSNIKQGLLSVGAVALVVGAFAVAAGVFTPTEASNKHYCSIRDSSSNAIMRGGACTPDELIKKYNADKKKGGDLRAIYNHYGLNINSFKNAKAGTVDQAGTVRVDGKVVAKNAYTMGRNDNRSNTRSKAVKINGKTYYQRADNRGQRHGTQPVMVVFDNYGRFQSAIINACGNPLIATATKPKPVASCDSLSGKAISRTSYEFAAKATAKNGAKVTGYTFDFGDGARKKQNSSSVKHEYKKAGTYTVTVTVHTNIGDKTGAKCKTSVVVKPQPPKKIEVCELSSSKIITINENQFDSKKHSKNLADCEKKPPVKENIKVCEIESGKIVTIDKKDFDEKKHSENLADCEKKPIEVCDIDSKTIVTIDEKDFDDNKHTTDLTKCEKETPPVEQPPKPPVEQPPVEELPETGVAGALVQLLGLGAVTASVVYYARSRQ